MKNVKQQMIEDMKLSGILIPILVIDCRGIGEGNQTAMSLPCRRANCTKYINPFEIYLFGCIGSLAFQCP